MKYFEFSWSYYEDSSSYLFYHESKTIKEFEADCKFLMIKYGNDYIEQEQYLTQAPRWIDFIIDKFSELGYERIIPVAFNIFGSYIIDDDREDGKCALKQVVGKELFDKAVNHNKKIKERIEK